ncbi:conserved protein, unknown function [Hepatocystis sp. ex Piliocolobus tephrosceles]|nr:conserved protein, unknown function [Hepatocystis sp. ex Piliocolobus tephrosceles]
MNEKKKNEKLIVNECVTYIKKYFTLHDTINVTIKKLIKIILNRSTNLVEGLEKKDEMDILIKNELTREFIKFFESAKLTLVEMKKCILKMKSLNTTIKNCKIKSTPNVTSVTDQRILYTLNIFFNNTLTYFKQDYKLKKKIHEIILHVDSTDENEIKRIQLMSEETPFLFLIFDKYNVNKLITECTQFLSTS